MTEEELRSVGWPADDARRYMAAYAAVKTTGDQISVPVIMGTETRSGDPYAGRPDTDVQTALAARGLASGYVGATEAQQFLAGAKASTVAQRTVTAGEIIRPGSGPDPHERERYFQQTWMETVGREFSAEELAGQPVPGCVACGRLAGMVCDDHARRTGEPIPLPPHPWPSEMAGHVPGTIGIRPGLYPGDLSRTVA